jgi:K+-sensing histidine kinase KdpD
LILSDLQGTVIYANKRVGELADLSTKMLTGMQVDQILARIIAKTAERSNEKTDVQNILNRKGERTVEISQSRSDRTTYLRLEVFNVNDEEGVSIGRGIFFHDITADRELDRMRSSLVSTVSHELRTPLAAIKGYVSTMLAEDVEWDRVSQHEFLTIISDESDRLTNLVNNLLDLSRIEAGSLKLSREKCEVKETINQAAKQAHLSEGNTFEIKIEPRLPKLYADPPRLETILRNLIENAVKYGGESANIRVEVCRQENDFLFRVIDNGSGIPEQERQHIFESFYRVDDSLARLTSGAGLGLAICQGLVRAHGGKIWAEAQELGACIAFTIPVRSSATNDHKKSKKQAKP